MEEVDKIIIDSLKHLQCDIGEEIDSLKEFDADMVVNAIAACLESINPGAKYPKKLPYSMSAKLNFATSLAQHIKDLGFRGDMGYQTILYCNEVEVRRVLMFLIERLPKETSNVTQIDQSGYVPRLVKKIEENLRNSVGHLWLPSPVLNQGVREIKGGYLVNSFGSSCPLSSVNLKIPATTTSNNEALKQYWVHDVPVVTEQCSSDKLISSLLFNDIEFPMTDPFLRQLVLKSTQNKNMVDNKIELITDISNEPIRYEIQTTDTENELLSPANIEPNKISELVKHVEEHKEKYKNLHKTVNNSELQLSQVSVMKSEEQKMLKDTIAKVKLKTKTLAVITKEENKAKLKNLIQTANDRLVELANQWNQIQTPLLNEYKSLKCSLSSEELKLQAEDEKLNNLRETHRELVQDLKQKAILKQHLVEKCQLMGKSNNRSAYTQRILEIVGNIKKQNIQIQKILKDTREVQKDINTLTGQVDRSFTLADELIFYDAKHDEMARKAYKLLAALREECSQILKAVTELGQEEREYRNIEEQFVTEKNKEIRIKLEKVYNDLEEIQREIKNLLET